MGRIEKMLQEEKALYKKGYKQIAGLDEAGRGPLAGPVTAAAVVVTLKSRQGRPMAFSARAAMASLAGVRDSKQLSPKKREELFEIITRHSQISWAAASVMPITIDRINIKNAAELAMARAVQKLKIQPDFLIIDGKYLKNHKLKTMNYKLIVKADEKVFACICASIIAKVTRDRKMMRYHKKYPQYGFSQHKGYPTKLHFARLKKHGPCIIHRTSFKHINI